MRKMLLTALLTMMGLGAFAIETVPIKGSIISQYHQSYGPIHPIHRAYQFCQS